MADQKLQYTVKAKRDDQGVLRSVLGDLTKFSASAGSLVSAPLRALTSLRGLGLAANLQLLRGLGNTIEQLVERGSRLEVVSKSFASLSGAAGPAAARLARQLQEAAQGTITQARAMEIANRALASGLSVGDVRTALEFVSKKAITTGKDAGAAIDTVITGLSRGSTLFLDDFGVLVDGIEGVTREFNRIKGANAFEQLGPAAQKAEIIRAAMADMRRQLSAIGVTGREMSFQVARIRSAMSDAVDKILGAVAGSRRFQQLMRDVASVASGIANAIGGPDQEKALDRLMSGGKEILSGLFVDLGRLLAKGVVEAAQQFGPRILDGLKAIGKFLLDTLLDAAAKFVAKIQQMLGHLDLFKGVFNQQAINRVLSRPSPAAPVIGAFDFRGHGNFEETTRALGDLAGGFRINQIGMDPIEKVDAAARGRVPMARRPALRGQLTLIQREQRILGQLARRGVIPPAFLKEAQRQIAAGQVVGVDPKRLSARERMQIARQRAAELRDARLTKLGAQELEVRRGLGFVPGDPQAMENLARMGRMAGGKATEILGQFRGALGGPVELFGRLFGAGAPQPGAFEGLFDLNMQQLGQNMLPPAVQRVLRFGRAKAAEAGEQLSGLGAAVDAGTDMGARGVPLSRDASFMEWMGWIQGRVFPNLGRKTQAFQQGNAPPELLPVREDLVPVTPSTQPAPSPQSSARTRGGILGGAADWIGNAASALMQSASQLGAAAAVNEQVASAFEGSSRKLAAAVAEI